MGHVSPLQVGEHLCQLVEDVLDDSSPHLGPLVDDSANPVETAPFAGLEEQVDGGVVRTENVVDELDDCAVVQCLQDEDGPHQHAVLASLFDVMPVVPLQCILLA